MKQIQILAILLALCGIGLIILAAYSVYDWFNTEQEIKIVDCFDRNGNKIIDVECEDDGADGYDLAFVVMFTSVMGIVIIAGSKALWDSGDYF